MNPLMNPVTNPDRPFGFETVCLVSQGALRAFSLRKGLFRRFLHSAMLIVAVCFVGCGESSQTASSPQPASGDSPAAQEGYAPKEIVSQFLDRVRRGGEDHDASSLLTKLAQQEMKRIGRPLQFPGSPDTRFEVHTAYPVNDDKDVVWVPTILSEPSSEGAESISYEVVWTVRKEKDGWRIGGFTTDQGPGLEPLFINFEDGAEMEQRLSQMSEDDEQIR